MVSQHHRTPRGRTVRAVLAASASALLLGTSLVSAPAAGAATAPVQAGLFGSQDPTYDGVFRQSLALLAYAAAHEPPPAQAVSWLLGQQCADGGFQAFRASTSVACAKSDPASYSGEDTNSTGIAAAALRALGRTAAADRALAWVLAAQNADGGFPYYVGGASDANSTAVVLLASNAAGRTPDSVRRGGVSAAQFLESLQIGCAGAATDDDGGFAFQDYGTGLVDSDTASVQATLAL
ncbi:MAG TPA: prenyltransferase/squalene oxidase repeat-containing protein, partial [Candidatus Angelobacter sp.]|nr:prenyltransferase/squalene oxidase repeat-containing protein [Candidatus Angelobacter sp.]